MAHVRTQIREAFKTELAANLPATGYAVFSSRKFKRNHDRAKAIVDIHINNVNISQQTMGDDRTHIASLYIRVQRSDAEDALDDALDNDEVLLTQIIEQRDWSSLLEEEPELVQVNFAEDSDSASAIGAIILRYDVEYRIDKTNPEIARN
ncbi:hypothetical protein QO034_18810 [Sedimentitalea sp. JM2-8]|uniref:Uncharacterized protein n=1 Tax=Sedimentitalea xiamensis TaxID=3050037 RepID=A0ABT7FJ28_9RHOB|nr:hypothetical protein [Sedimentitalea xiamensis]MDK3075143.1 hypothetical protein [Sedimentitalea xiamensis]